MSACFIGSAAQLSAQLWVPLLRTLRCDMSTCDMRLPRRNRQTHVTVLAKSAKSVHASTCDVGIHASTGEGENANADDATTTTDVAEQVTGDAATMAVTAALSPWMSPSPWMPPMPPWMSNPRELNLEEVQSFRWNNNI